MTDSESNGQWVVEDKGQIPTKQSRMYICKWLKLLNKENKRRFVNHTQATDIIILSFKQGKSGNWGAPPPKIYEKNKSKENKW